MPRIPDARLKGQLDLLYARYGAGFLATDPICFPSRLLDGFVQRFNDARDVGLLFCFMRQMLESHGSVEAFFMEGYEPGHDDIGPSLASFTRRALELDGSPYHAGGGLPADAGVRFSLSSSDPVKYDFALSRLGMREGCPRHAATARCELRRPAPMAACS